MIFKVQLIHTLPYLTFENGVNDDISNCMNEKLYIIK